MNRHLVLKDQETVAWQHTRRHKYSDVIAHRSAAAAAGEQILAGLRQKQKYFRQQTLKIQ